MLFTKITLNLLIIKVICCEDNFNIRKLLKDEKYADTTECIETIIRKYFPCGTLVTTVDMKEKDTLIQTLNNKINCYTFIVRYYDHHDWAPTAVYVIRAEDVTEFTTGFLANTMDLFWNPRGRFIIELEVSKEGDADTVFKILMKHKVFDAVLIRKSKNNLVIDTFYPFKNNNCGQKIDVSTIGDCNDVASLDIFRNEKNNLRNCTIKVAATQDIPNFIYKNSEYTDNGKDLLGLEQFVLDIIAKKEGIKIDSILFNRDKKFGNVLGNYTATGLLGVLQNCEADIAAGGFVLMRNRVLLFDFIWGYSYSAFKVFTPATDEEVWRDVYNEFSEYTWLLIVIAYCLVVAMTTIRRKLLFKRSHNLQNICLALRLWGYFYLNTSARLSKDKRHRLIMLFWIWFTFFVTNFYNTALYSLLTGRDQMKREISVDSLSELPYEPCISTSTRTLFQFAFNQTLPHGDKDLECQFSDNALEYVATEQNAYAIEMEYFYSTNAYKFKDEHGHTTLDTWAFSSNNVIAMFITRGFPLRDTFQMYAFRIYESGLVQHQLDKIIRVKNSYPLPLHHVHFDMLELLDLRIHFCVLFLGYALSILCFILEITWHRHSYTLIAKWKFYGRPDNRVKEMNVKKTSVKFKNERVLKNSK